VADERRVRGGHRDQSERVAVVDAGVSYPDGDSPSILRRRCDRRPGSRRAMTRCCQSHVGSANPRFG
jgi:hypothetical protein